MTHDEDSSEELSLENYYSLLELLDKLGKDGVAELVTKGKPRRITQGDMIYFYKTDVNRILGIEELEGPESLGLIVDDQVDEIFEDEITSQLSFRQTLIKRQKIGKDQEVHRDKELDLSKEILYGRSQGDPKMQEIFKQCGIISSLHGKLYLDEDNNLLYENLGANKSKIRGCKDKSYTVLDINEVGVLIPCETLQELTEHPHRVVASIKLGYQLKPHFIIRIKVCKK